jgi:hypothetical protein
MVSKYTRVKLRAQAEYLHRVFEKTIEEPEGCGCTIWLWG